MMDLIYRLEGNRPALTEIGNLSITDKRGKLIFIVRINAADSVTLEIVDFEEYADYLGYGVKVAKIIRAAKCADLAAVQAALTNVVTLEPQAASQ